MSTSSYRKCFRCGQVAGELQKHGSEKADVFLQTGRPVRRLLPNPAWPGGSPCRRKEGKEQNQPDNAFRDEGAVSGKSSPDSGPEPGK